MIKMDPLLRSLLSTVLCVGGPVLLWVVFIRRPDLFVGKLKQVQWLTAIFMAIMILTLAGGFLIDRRQPPKSARVVPPVPTITEPVTAPVIQSEADGKASFRRFFEIGDKK